MADREQESWTSAGVRVGDKRKKVFPWVDPSGETMHFGKLTGAAVSPKAPRFNYAGSRTLSCTIFGVAPGSVNHSNPRRSAKTGFGRRVIHRRSRAARPWASADRWAAIAARFCGA